MNAQLQTDQTPNPELLAAPGAGDRAAIPHSALRTPHLAVLPEPKPHKRIRNGKIARLPYLERDMVNRMLRDNIPYEKIVDALGQHDFYVIERNVSNWKTRGG